jgi:hypothetical protein
LPKKAALLVYKEFLDQFSGLFWLEGLRIITKNIVKIVLPTETVSVRI